MADNTLYADGLIFPKPTLLLGDDSIIKSAPAPTLSSLVGYPAIVKSAPVPTLSSTLDQSEIITLSGSAAAPRLSSMIITGEVVTAALLIPKPSLVSILVNPAIITAAGSARAPRLAAAILSGNVATAALLASTPELVSAGYPAYTITAVLTAPAPYLKGHTAEMVGALPATYRTWVLNLRKGALTEYDSWAFNSYTTFNGVVLACGSSGIVVLGTQGVDNATAITGRFRTGQESFESSVHKRVPRIYASGTFGGDTIFRTITEGGTRSYSLPFNGITRLQQRRVPVGKGPKSRFWQFEVEGVSGADFGVNDVLVLPTVLRRRVQ